MKANRFEDSARAAEYDSAVVGVIPGYHSLHQSAAAILRERLGPRAHILIAGAGGGHESALFALQNSRWKISGFDPAAAMIFHAHARIKKHKLESRVKLFAGDIGAIKSPPQFDAATSLLVMHFLPDDGAKENYLRAIAKRLKPNAPLILADVEFAEGGIRSKQFRLRLAEWKRFQINMRDDSAAVEKDFAHVLRDVHFLTPPRIAELFRAAGFRRPRRFFQALVIGGWIAEKNNRGSRQKQRIPLIKN